MSSPDEGPGASSGQQWPHKKGQPGGGGHWSGGSGDGVGELGRGGEGGVGGGRRSSDRNAHTAKAVALVAGQGPLHISRMMEKTSGPAILQRSKP